MKQLAALAAAAVAAATPAFAGPDWQAIEQSRDNQRAQVAQTEKLTPTEKCAAKRLVLPVDHGPRAQSTPFVNEQLRRNFEAELEACKKAASASRAR